MLVFRAIVPKLALYLKFWFQLLHLRNRIYSHSRLQFPPPKVHQLLNIPHNLFWRERNKFRDDLTVKTSISLIRCLINISILKKAFVAWIRPALSIEVHINAIPIIIHHNIRLKKTLHNRRELIWMVTHLGGGSVEFWRRNRKSATVVNAVLPVNRRFDWWYLDARKTVSYPQSRRNRFWRISVHERFVYCEESAVNTPLQAQSMLMSPIGPWFHTA